MKKEGTQQLSCTGNLEKALPHQPLPPPFLVPTVQGSSTHTQIGLISHLHTQDPVLNHKVDLMVLIDYDGQREKIYIYACGIMDIVIRNGLCVQILDKAVCISLSDNTHGKSMGKY